MRKKMEHYLHYLALGAALGQAVLLMVLYTGARGEMARIVAAGLLGVVAGLVALAARPVRRRAPIRYHVRRRTGTPSANSTLRELGELGASWRAKKADEEGWRRERTENPGGGSGDAQ